MGQFIKRQFLNLVLTALMLLGTGVPFFTPPARAIDAPKYQWLNTGIIASESLDPCFDGTRPGWVVANKIEKNGGIPTGSYAFNLTTGETRILNNHGFNMCNPATGFLYESRYPENTYFRFSIQDPTPRQIERYPSLLSSDGSLVAYSWDQSGSLYVSYDAGLTWRVRPVPFSNLKQVILTKVDGKSLYALSYALNNADRSLPYAIYFSPDAGQTWEKRTESKVSPANGFTGLRLQQVQGNITPVDTILLGIGNGIPGSNGATAENLSLDGGRSFTEVGQQNFEGNVTFYQTFEGIVRLTARFYSLYFNLDQTGDGGKTWQNLSLPSIPDQATGVTFKQAENGPENFFYSHQDHLGNIYYWYSANGGRSWESLITNLYTNPNYLSLTGISPYLPLTLLATQTSDRRLFTLDLPQAGNTQTLPFVSNGAPGGTFFKETSHNISPFFRPYWDANGGLMQFGFPKTEAFREVNPADGKIYTVQYFERNRFEYHPENAGTKYEIELGLLGNQLSKPYYNAGHGAFNRFSNANYPGGTYFPETGHNLRNAFKAYWDANGGLGLYGYPISEEFYEVNPDDGQTYVVQYFERNRFEWHPENKGTRFEVLLGLLGNAHLRQKGWLS